MENITLVIARYNEDLNWLEESPFNEFQYIVYNKGDNENFCKTNVISIINLPNVGKCDHTYLYHIVANFDNLNDILVFLPGSLDMSCKKEKATEILNRIKINNYQKAVFIGEYSRNILKEFFTFTLDTFCISHSQNLEKNNSCFVHPANIRPFGKWYLHNFGNISVNYYTFWGIFSVHKNDILQHSKYRYEKLLHQLELSSHPEAGHFIERSWGAIFYPMKNTRVLVNNIQPIAYKKPKYIFKHIKKRMNKYKPSIFLRKKI